MRIRDKIITAACLTRDGIEWTSLNLKQGETELVGEGFVPIAQIDVEDVETTMTTVQLPDGIAEQLAGDLTASIRTSELLMRTMEFPTADPAEIASMVGFQIDKISPFPLDQLAVSHEILKTTEKGAMVLMVAVKHECIDAIGEYYEQKGIHIHSMDARVLGWLHLLRSGGHLEGSGCEILLIDDGIDFAMVVLSEGLPMAFRALLAKTGDDDLAGELAHEIGYTLTMLDAEHDLPAPDSIHFWGLSDLPMAVRMQLKAVTGLEIRCGDLASLPPLSKGIIERAQHTDNRIELIPSEWVEHERNKRLRKKYTKVTAVIVSVWLAFMLVFTIVYQTRAIQLSRIQKRADAIAPSAAKAFENRKKLRALKIYTDRSNSALECLREVTQLLPASDIDFASYNYNKGKGVTVRGSAEDDDAVYTFFGSLSKSPLFKELKDQSVNKRNTRGEVRSVFSATLVLPSEEEDK